MNFFSDLYDAAMMPVNTVLDNGVHVAARTEEGSTDRFTLTYRIPEHGGAPEHINILRRCTCKEVQGVIRDLEGHADTKSRPSRAGLDLLVARGGHIDDDPRVTRRLAKSSRLAFEAEQRTCGHPARGGGRGLLELTERVRAGINPPYPVSGDAA